jgi:ADP-ribose pyrophosphatase
MPFVVAGEERNVTQSDHPDPPLGEVLSSERGFDGAWVHVRVDRVRLPSGRVTARETVEHPGSVAIVGVTADDMVLLLRQSHHPIQRTLLGLPAGTLEPGETPEACARRELLEETGFKAGPLTLLADYFTSPGYTSEKMTIFLAEDCSPAGGEIDPDELIAVRPHPLTDIPRLVTPGPDQVADAKTLIGLLLFLRLRSS